MTIDTTLLKQLEKISKGLELHIYTKSNEGNSKITNLDVLFTKICRPKDRIASGSFNPKIQIAICKKDVGTIMNMELVEMEPCCGKLFGRRLNVYNQFWNYCDKPEHFSEDELFEIYKIFMKIVEMITENATYTSLSFIVSEPENQIFYKFIQKIDSYKIINQFRNERMSNKNLCLEYCKNFYGN